MALIRSRGNKSTEMALISLLRKNKISGWRRHSKTVAGRPDFIFPKQKIAVFVDGCFWHGCPQCSLIPKSNKKYWDLKIERNKKRDLRIKRELMKKRWIVVRIWEHSLKRKKLNEIRLLNKLMLAH